MKDHTGIAEIGSDMGARFANLKQRLLLQRLNETPDVESHALIIQQAKQAALGAWRSAYPLLTFPCLFEERADAVTEQVRREAAGYWNGLGAQAAARAA